MTLLSISNLGVDFGATTILRDVTFTVAQGERWGIVGRNGAGKTTIFRVITGEVAPTVGAVARQPGLRIAMLDQHRDFGEAVTVWAAAAQAYRDVIELEQSLHAQGERMAELGDRLTEADLTQYGHDQERFAHLGGYDYHAKVDAVLHGLGFDPVEAQTRLLDFGTYGPVLVEAAAKGTPEQRKFLVTAPENIKDMLILKEEQAALYSKKYENDWNRMQLE